MLVTVAGIFFAALLSLCGYQCNTAQTPPIVGMELGTSGYHRDLSYTVQFDYPLAGKEECEYLLVQPLPAAVYVSVDQLNDLQRLKKLHAIYPKFVDIEVSTNRGVPFSVLLRGTPKITDSIRLPIHFRYHSARVDDSKFVPVELTSPSMYMRCTHNTLTNGLIDSDLLETTHGESEHYCLQAAEAAEAAPFLRATERPSTGADCDWQRIKVDYQIQSPLRAEIPVGNANAFPPVLYATIIVSWLVSLWTVFRTQAVPRRINQKLEEQRVLQRKMK